MVVFVVGVAVVEEASDAASLLCSGSAIPCTAGSVLMSRPYSSAVRVHNKDQSIKLSNGVDTRRSDLALSFFGIPYLEIPASSFRARCSKLEIRCPFGLQYPGSASSGLISNIAS